VFVTGTGGGGSGSLQDYATVAYRASDGTQLWVARFNSPVNDNDNADAVSVARDGTAVFVTGCTWDGSASSMTTVAYRATDGAQQWVKSWSAPGANYNGNAIVSPGGNRVFVTGHVQSNRFLASTARWPTTRPLEPGCGSGATPALARHRSRPAPTGPGCT
jgi:outer membrane protein assembly factor BamB